MSQLPPPLPVMPLPPIEPPRPPSRRRWLLIGSVVVVVVAAVATVGGLSWRAYQRTQPPPMVREDVGDKYREASAAFTETPMGSDQQERAAIGAMFDSLGAAVRRGDNAAVGDRFDVDRLILELKRHNVLPAMRAAEARGFKTGMSNTAPAAFAKNDLLKWTRYEIRRVRPLGGGEAMVYFRGWDDTGYIMKSRWWLRKHSGGWRFYDLEDLDTGIRVSAAMGAAMTGASFQTGTMPPWVNAIKSIPVATQQLTAGEIDKAEATLATLEGTNLPPEFDAVRLLLMSAVRLRQERFPEAVELLDKADALRADLPASDHLRAIALNGLGRHEEAVRFARQYVDLLGGDGHSYSTLGDALTGAGRKDEAAAAYRKGLDDSPDSADCLAGLAKAVGTAGGDELARRLRATTKPADVFSGAADVCVGERAGDAIAALVEAYRPVARGADDPWLLYYDGEAKVLLKRYAEAAALLNRALPLAPPGNEQVFHDEYLHAFALADQPLEGYAGSPQPDVAFIKYADDLVAEETTDRIRQLIMAHRAKRPDDGWLDYYEGRALMKEGKPKVALARYARGLKAVAGDEGATRTYQLARADAAFAAGNGLAAYDGTLPEATFDRLAPRYAEAKHADGLAKLIAAHRKRVPADPDLPVWDAEVEFLRGQYKRVVQLLTEHRARTAAAAAGGGGEDAAADEDWRVSDRLIRSLVRLKWFDEALAEVRRAAGDGEPDHWYLAMIHAAAGKVREAAAALDTMIADEDYEVDASNFYEDADLGPALRTPAFAAWRKKHPEGVDDAPDAPE